MSPPPAMAYGRLAAEIRAEVERIQRTADEIARAQTDFGSRSDDRLVLYGTAALLDTFYTGLEKAFGRIAAMFGGVPEGSGWHRSLLEDMLDSSLLLPLLREVAPTWSQSRHELEHFISLIEKIAEQLGS